MKIDVSYTQFSKNLALLTKFNKRIRVFCFTIKSLNRGNDANNCTNAYSKSNDLVVTLKSGQFPNTFTSLLRTCYVWLNDVFLMHRIVSQYDYTGTRFFGRNIVYKTIVYNRLYPRLQYISSLYHTYNFKTTITYNTELTNTGSHTSTSA